ncbi:GTP cyclohydrolase FolE2 [Piscirickettsia salmonis]|nr:GTP cyclohydrolase FolE2 [Piscirickettsia salmonis LF-89 = ATCC VR-1361]ALY03137.1 GTP cyclohydrolase FolE2 [Piscirickettsia salmonis]AMA42696.1 GTP cyclohydrolase FolE2 [Piscirickettsia salmonis]AOS35168.1 GTP cyclohydrolase FolE2 [Piscirickettsia salmonis]APS59874.1 GTP cyclohydrolase FolE2 [Piscirickettsia salmonis]
MRNNMPTSSIADIQNLEDPRNIPINHVGIRQVRHPIQISDRSHAVLGTVGTFKMYVDLPAHIKGTHMSRFIALLHEHEQTAYSVQNFNQLTLAMTERLQAQKGLIEMQFTYFRKKTAPISQQQSYLDYEVTFLGKADGNNAQTNLRVVIPVTSLCPCSKAISKYGAHNQRSHITVEIETCDLVWVDDLIELAEAQASSELYGLIKRADEKYVTETAYENPKFVEDLVRDVAEQLNHDQRISAYKVESENFESIHNHSAYAVIEQRKKPNTDSRRF